MDDTQNLIVAPAVDVRRDFKKNLPYLAILSASALLYVIVVSLLISQWESGWSFLHSCYFTVINMTTVGFGDVYPLTHIGKVLAGVNGVAGLVIFGCFVAIFVMAFQPSEWTTHLTSASSEPKAQGNQQKGEMAGTVQEGLAEMLEGLARTIRCSDTHKDKESGTGRVRVTIFNNYRDTDRFVAIEVSVTVRE